MQANQQLHFLQEKIKEIRSAIFFNLSDSVLKLPSTIVATLQVDDYGYVWFFVKKPRQHVTEFEAEFPVRLDYFKKGIDCFLQVSGKAWVVHDPEDIVAFTMLTGNAGEVSSTDRVLVKVKMLKAEYYETQSGAQNSWWQNVVGNFVNWFGYGNSVSPNTYFPLSS
ncbi:MAG: pyridoxamine 5'-phosphate oxidase family protein [Chitinophagaceae bacterium]